MTHLRSYTPKDLGLARLHNTAGFGLQYGQVESLYLGPRPQLRLCWVYEGRVCNCSLLQVLVPSTLSRMGAYIMSMSAVRHPQESLSRYLGPSMRRWQRHCPQDAPGPRLATPRAPGVVLQIIQARCSQLTFLEAGFGPVSDVVFVNSSVLSRSDPLDMTRSRSRPAGSGGEPRYAGSLREEPWNRIRLSGKSRIFRIYYNRIML